MEMDYETWERTLPLLEELLEDYTKKSHKIRGTLTRDFLHFRLGQLIVIEKVDKYLMDAYRPDHSSKISFKWDVLYRETPVEN